MSEIWQKDIVKSWFSNDEPVKILWLRANQFLRQHLINGIKIVCTVVETQSYEAFMLMPRLALLLLFEYLKLRKLMTDSAAGPAGGDSSLFHGFCTFVSSDKQTLPCIINQRHASACRVLPVVYRGLECLARLPTSMWGILGPVKTVSEMLQPATSVLLSQHEGQKDQKDGIAVSSESLEEVVLDSEGSVLVSGGRACGVCYTIKAKIFFSGKQWGR